MTQNRENKTTYVATLKKGKKLGLLIKALKLKIMWYNNLSDLKGYKLCAFLMIKGIKKKI